MSVSGGFSFPRQDSPVRACHYSVRVEVLEARYIHDIAKLWPHLWCLQWYYSPLHIAALHGRVEVVQILLDAGVDLHALDKVRVPWCIL